MSLRSVLKVAMNRDVVAIDTKVYRYERLLPSEGKASTWYKLFDIQEDIDKVAWFTLSQELVATYPMAEDIRL